MYVRLARYWCRRRLSIAEPKLSVYVRAHDTLLKPSELLVRAMQEPSSTAAPWMVLHAGCLAPQSPPPCRCKLCWHAAAGDAVRPTRRQRRRCCVAAAAAVAANAQPLLLLCYCCWCCRAVMLLMSLLLRRRPPLLLLLESHAHPEPALRLLLPRHDEAAVGEP
eukprot:TRINITY_DN4603_c0_g1_i3.p1 TRINITY_DN4603_c0_g1~~TRINITY_DN4603_c0_g1_i3.p1  ORF type:complete len:164 (-),score=37.66 TRINITY_DN4603_c0_g1_i3:162-653(-)